jgi:FkbM family methyltransferase
MTARICIASCVWSVMLRSALKRLLLTPYWITRAIDRAYERVLATVISGEFASTGREEYLNSNNKRQQRVRHIAANGAVFEASFFTPNQLCMLRAKTFSTKEPEILSWIDEFGGDGALFDIGANVGLYSIYYAKTKRGTVYAFEPSVFNLAVLAKNISANELSGKISIVSNPLAAENGFARFKFSSATEGGALNTFGVDYGYDGTAFASSIEFGTLGFSLDYLIENKIVVDVPSMIKVDVDGIEHLILRGACNTLKAAQCRTVFVEVADSFAVQAQAVNEILTESGFTLHRKVLDVATANGAITANQIWIKSEYVAGAV